MAPPPRGRNADRTAPWWGETSPSIEFGQSALRPGRRNGPKLRQIVGDLDDAVAPKCVAHRTKRARLIEGTDRKIKLWPVDIGVMIGERRPAVTAEGTVDTGVGGDRCGRSHERDRVRVVADPQTDRSTGRFAAISTMAVCGQPFAIGAKSNRAALAATFSDHAGTMTSAGSQRQSVSLRTTATTTTAASAAGRKTFQPSRMSWS